MATYLLVYHGGRMEEGSETQAQVMEAWNGWFDTLGDALVDGGNPVSESRTIEPDGTVAHGDGVNPVSGYSIINAESLDHAVLLATACPVLQGGATIEVCETVETM